MTTATEVEREHRAPPPREPSGPGPAGFALGPIVRIGAIGGVVAIYLCVVGIIERFNQRDVVTDVVTLGYALLIVVWLVWGVLAAGRVREAPGSSRVAAGAVAGAVSGLMLVLFAVAFKALYAGDVNPREILISLSLSLLDDILLLGRGTAMGGFLLAGIATVLGALGAALSLLTEQWRRTVVTALITFLLLSLSQPLLFPILDSLKDRTNLLLFDPDLLYEGVGLKLGAAIFILVAAAAISHYWQLNRNTIRQRFVPESAQQRKVAKAAGYALLLGALLLFPAVAGQRLSDIAGTVGLYVLLALGLNIVVGYAGLLDLGYVAFFAVGAYATALLTSPSAALVAESQLTPADSGLMPFWIAIPLVIVVAVIIGVLIGAPVLRLRGDYLAIVTLGFGEIIRTLVLSDWLKPWLGGPQGIINIPAPPPAGLDLRDPEKIYYLILAFCIVAVYLSYRLSDSRVGRAWIAMREDESVAESMGISVIKYKLLAFAIGAGVGCLGGAFFAAKLGSIFPSSFILLVSINVLAVIILGGMGSIPGVAVGALVLVGLPELLREFNEYRLLIYGAVLVAIMILRPEGLIPSKRRRLELHEEEILTEELAHAGDGKASILVPGRNEPPE